MNDVTDSDKVNDVADEGNVNGITDNDKLMAALCYPIGVVMSIIILVSEPMKARPFQKFHAVQALAFWVVVIVVATVLAIVTLGIGSVCFPVLWLVSLWPAYKAYQGEYYELPVITNFIRKQGWVD